MTVRLHTLRAQSLLWSTSISLSLSNTHVHAWSVFLTPTHTYSTSMLSHTHTHTHPKSLCCGLTTASPRSLHWWGSPYHYEEKLERCGFCLIYTSPAFTLVWHGSGSKHTVAYSQDGPLANSFTAFVNIDIFCGSWIITYVAGLSDVLSRCFVHESAAV